MDSQLLSPEASALHVAEGVRAGEVSAVEVARAALERAATLDDALGAFAHLCPGRALEQATAIDAARAAGDELPPLAGVPCPAKDLVTVEGLPMRAGSRAMGALSGDGRGPVSPTSDVVVARLEAAGTTTIGTTAVPEMGFPAYTEPDVQDGSGRRAARTPWDLARGAGGSSGGASAAVAAGIVPIAHASDGGGSIRIPASSCGIVGHKASRGLIGTLPSRTPGPGLVTDGVVSRTVADTVAALQVLSEGALGLDPTDLGGDLAPLRVGLLTTPVIGDGEVDPVCRTAAEQAAGWLAQLGHHVVEDAPVPYAAERWAAFDAVWATGAAALPLPEGAEELLTPMTRWLRERGRTVTGVQLAAALAEMQRLAHEVEGVWADYDVILTPTLAQPPAAVGSLRDDEDPQRDWDAQCAFTPWTSTANLTGRPSISLPLARAEVEGVELPIGIMLTGRLGRDTELLRLAAQLEAAHPWPLVRTPDPTST